MPQITIPAALLPADGRFGCGPSKVRVASSSTTSPRPAPPSSAPRTARPRSRTSSAACAPASASSSALPDGYEVVLGNGGSTAFWDAAAFGLIERRSQNLRLRRVRRASSPRPQPPRGSRRPHVRQAPTPARAATPEAVDGVDVYAWPHNETSTGVMAPVTRVAGDAGALTVVDATSAAGGIDFDARRDRRLLLRPAEELRLGRRPLVRAVLPRGDRAGRADRRQRPLHPRVPQPEERDRQLAPQPDAQHPGARDAAAAGEPARLDQRQRRPGLGRRPHPRVLVARSTTGRSASTTRPRSSTTPTTARRSSSRSTSTTRSTRPPSPRRCAPTASSTPSRTASSAATSCASPPSRRSSPTTCASSSPRSSTWSASSLIRR